MNYVGGKVTYERALAGAKAAFERALKIFEQFLPPDHPNIKKVQGNLGSLNNL